MTAHFDATRWDSMMKAIDQAAEGQARCEGCGIVVAVVNDDVRIRDGELLYDGQGRWIFRCSGCAGATASR